MEAIFQTVDPLLLICIIGGIVVFAIAYFTNQFFNENKSRTDIKKRLTREEIIQRPLSEDFAPKQKTKNGKISNKVAKKANDFYSGSDPDKIKKIRLTLMQAGYMQPGAVGYFIASRFIAAVIFAVLGILLALTYYSDQSTAYKICVIIGASALGYFLPNIYLNRKVSEMELSNRQGFPDILDLMVVSAEAGLTMEASIERISSEIAHTYPNLSIQLNMAALEIRAGRPIDQALQAFGERLKLDEVKGFATMVQQAKELGTSVSDALRVYSEEMRHKRMMLAEEKAYALPAKMSVPVTAFILPIVIGIAILPTVVKLSSGS